MVFSFFFRFFRFFSVFFSVFSVCFGVSVVSLLYRNSEFRLIRNKQKTHPNSLKESIFGYFSENLGLFRFVTKQFCLFRLFRYRFETPKQTETLCFWFHKTNRNKRKTNAKQVLIRFVSVRTENYFCLFRGHPSLPVTNVYYYKSPQHNNNYVLCFTDSGSLWPMSTTTSHLSTTTTTYSALQAADPCDQCLLIQAPSAQQQIRSLLYRQRILVTNVYYYKSPQHNNNYVLSFTGSGSLWPMSMLLQVPSALQQLLTLLYRQRIPVTNVYYYKSPQHNNYVLSCTGSGSLYPVSTVLLHVHSAQQQLCTLLCRQRIPVTNVYYYKSPQHNNNYVLSFAGSGSLWPMSTTTSPLSTTTTTYSPLPSHSTGKTETYCIT